MKIATLVFVCCLVFEVTSLTPIKAISSGYVETINKTAFKILKNLFDESTKIAFGKQHIAQLITEAKESIQDEINELKEFIKDEIEDAKEDSIDISSCLNLTNIRKINVGPYFNRCKMPVQFKHMESQKDEMGKLNGAFPEEIQICVLASTILGKDMDICFENKIDLVEKKLVRISKSIEALMSAATDNSAACVQEVVRSLDAAVTKAAKDYEECVDDIDFNSD